MRVHAWLADTGGCGYYRGMLPHRILDGLDGFHATAGTILSAELGNDLDLLWAQRVTRPGPTARLDALRAQGRLPIVIDADDALDLIPATSLMPHAYYLGPTSGPTIEDWVANLNKADLVTTSTLTLAEHLVNTHGIDDAIVVPNTIDARAADEPLHPILGHPFPTTIGYQGSDTHWHDVGVLEYALRRIGKRHRDDHVGLHMIGHDWRAPLERWSDPKWERGEFYLGTLPAVWTYPDELVRYTPWLANIVELYQVIRGFDIGLAPLADDEFNRHKSPIKLLEYGALGVPWVASPVGPYAQYAAEAGSAAAAGGMFARTEADWLHALEDLIANPDLAAELVANGAAYAAQWTTQEHVAGYAAVYTHLTKGHQP